MNKRISVFVHKPPPYEPNFVGILTLKNDTYKIGTTANVNRVPTAKPKASTVAIPKNSEVLSNIKGSNPITVVTVVIVIGRSRVKHEFITA